MNFVCNSPILNNLNIPKVQFRSNTAYHPVVSNPAQDSFCTNPLYGNNDKTAIMQIAKSNPRLMDILKENDLRLEVNTKELENLQKGHLMDTRVTVAKIYSALLQEIKANINLSDLQQAAMLHDYGKIFIPDKILNKSGKLNEQERQIMELHSELGYEFLKSLSAKQGGEINENVLNLVKYHHQNVDGNGYPAVEGGFEPSVSTQILSVADKYSALKEERSYKPAMSRDEALTVIREDVDTGKVDEEIYNALAKSV